MSNNETLAWLIALALGIMWLVEVYVHHETKKSLDASLEREREYQNICNRYVELLDLASNQKRRIS